MPNTNPFKTPADELNAKDRIKNFDEVSKGYTKEQAIEEAKRCLNCKNKPCTLGCPVHVPIPDFIECIVKEDFKAAYDIIKGTNSFPAVCGRVCPQESQCESKCVRGIKGEPVSIGRLERFVADWNLKNNIEQEHNCMKNGHKIAVVGSGPSGLACAGELCNMGYEVTIYEAFHKAGGVLVYGIPEFRLPKNIVEHEIDNLKKSGVNICTNVVVGKTITVDELLSDGFEAVYIATGAGLPNFMGIPGEEYIGVYSANEFLTRITLMKAYKKDYDTPIVKPKSVAVIGGGNVAMDAARSAKRLGADHVYIVYRRSEDEIPARKEEINHAKEEGIEFKFLCNPIEIYGDENYKVKGIKCVKMQLLEPDDSGRKRPVAIEGSEFDINVDCVIMAIGNSPNPLIKLTTEGITANKKGCLVVDENLKTTKEAVYAGGDAVTGAATVILAMGAGKKAAKSIDEFIKGK